MTPRTLLVGLALGALGVAALLAVVLVLEHSVAPTRDALTAQDRVFHYTDERNRTLRDLATKKGGFTPADARTLMNSTRKFVIPLLEALDKAGFSRRAGDKRVVR